MAVSGCSEYDLKAKSGPEEGAPDTGEPVSEGTPRASLSTSVVDFGAICGRQSTEVTVQNVGDALLQVTSVRAEPDAWIAVHAPVPASLFPGESFSIEISGTAGAGVLYIETTDPSQPELTVSLLAAPDEAPEISIDTPTMDAVLDVGSVSEFVASVSDDLDAPEALTLQWSSDVDGALGAEAADAAGTATLDWSAADQSSGAHVVTLTATDSCGNTAETDVVLCQNEGYFADNLDLATWNFEGSALWDTANSWVELTSASTNQSGTAFQTASTVDSSNVQIEFDFFASGGSGADGLSMTALDSSRMSSFVGSSGGGIGYAGLPGWSVEVDTWYNGEHNDPTSLDHLSLHIDGNINTPVAWTPLPEMEDGAWHRMAVSVTGSWMTVSVDGTVYIDQDVPALTSFPAYVGFTAATGSATNHHLIDALEVEEFVCE